jgi:nicotinamide phosphoribosyltransferase
LKEMGYASTNWLRGIGSYLYVGNSTRDTFGFAVKATAAVVDGVMLGLQKKPMTDTGKTSALGYLMVTVDENGDYTQHQNVTKEQEETGELKSVWKDGQFVKEMTLSEVRANLPIW